MTDIQIRNNILHRFFLAARKIASGEAAWDRGQPMVLVFRTAAGQEAAVDEMEMAAFSDSQLYDAIVERLKECPPQ